MDRNRENIKNPMHYRIGFFYFFNYFSSLNSGFVIVNISFSPEDA